MVSKNVEHLSWNNFKNQLKNNYPVFLFILFLYWTIYLTYKAFLLLLGLDTLLANLGSVSLNSVLILFELPFVYALCVLFVYLLKRMFYQNLKTKDYFYIGLKLFILNLVFLIILGIFLYLFSIYDSIGYAIALIIVGLFSLFFMFVGYKHIINNNLLSMFAKTFAEIKNPKAIAYYLLTMIGNIILYGVGYGLVYLGLVPSMAMILLYPLIIFSVFYFSYFSVN